MQYNNNTKKIIIACASIQPELEMIIDELTGIEVVFLEQGLHRFPDRMPAVIQEKLDALSEYQHIEQIILGYGLCSNGVVGLKARRQGLIVPKVHDCITFFLGSKDKYDKVFHSYPGTYYLTKSWIDEQKDLLGLMQNEYTQRVGRKDAEWAIKEETKNYTHIAYIQTIQQNAEKYRTRAKENAEYFKKQYIEFKGKFDFLNKMVHGPYDNKNFIVLNPGEEVRQKFFYK